MNEPLPDLLARAATMSRDGRDVVACLLVRARGSTPQAAGALMLVDDAALTHGTIGGGCVEAEVRRRACAMRADGRRGRLTFTLDHDYGWDDGLICGGTIEIAVGTLPDATTLDAIVADIRRGRATTVPVITTGDADETVRYDLHVAAREHLVIAGAGHVGQALARLAVKLEFDVTVVDDRHDLLEHVAGPGVECRAGDIAATLRDLPIDERTSCVIVTRGHRHDEQALEAVLRRGAAYVGMIGSRRKVKLIRDDLIERGLSEADLAPVRAPIGLDIGAISVEEIALSIAAELVQTRRATRRDAVSGPHAVALASPTT